MKQYTQGGGANSFRPDWKNNRGRGRRSESLRKYSQFKRVKFHRRRHADEILAHMLLFTKAGREVFPNLDPNCIEYATDNECDYRDNPDVLHIGCGKDPTFDEHFLDDSWHSACTLMAIALGLLDHPVWKKTLEDVRREDREGKAVKGEIAWLVKSLYRSHGGTIESEEEVARWAEVAYGAEIDSPKDGGFNFKKPLTTKTAVALLTKQGYKDIDWFRKMVSDTTEYESCTRKHAKTTFIDKSVCYRFSHETKGLINLYTIEDDNEGVASICWGFGADIVVIRKTNGHNAILTNYNNGKNLDLWSVLDQLQRQEVSVGASWTPVGNNCTLVLNGSKTHPDVVPSGLSLKDIAGIISSCMSDSSLKVLGQGYEAFEKELDRVCKK